MQGFEQTGLIKPVSRGDEVVATDSGSVIDIFHGDDWSMISTNGIWSSPVNMGPVM